MPEAFVKNCGTGTDNGSGQTFTIPVVAAPSAGNTLLLGIYCEDAAIVGITDSKGNTWVKDNGLFVATTYGSIEIWRCHQDVGALTTSDTITPDHGTTFVRPSNWSLDEFSGVLTPSPLDQVGSINNTAGGQTITATGATTQADEAVYLYFNGMNGSALTFDALLTPTGVEVASASGGIAVHRTRAAYQILTATGTPSYTNTRTGGSKSMAILATYKAAGAGGASDPTPPPVIAPSQAVHRSASW